MATKKNHRLEAQNPLILLCNRLMEAFAKSDDERDFYLDRQEGFIIYVDLDKPTEDLEVLENELEKNADRYCLIPKLTFYETKKIMEGFIQEKVYDIDTKEKLLDIIQSKEARENFLEFIYDHHSELEKWQSYYQERSRIRIIEWLRANHFHFVFEEDLEFPAMLLEKLKRELFQTKVGKDILTARKTLVAKSKTYYSNEALNPRPKRGRPPKQALKAEVERQVSTDIYTTVPSGLLGFLFTPDLTNASSATFSSKFGNEEDLFINRRAPIDFDLNGGSIDQKLAALRSLSTKWKEPSEEKPRLSAALKFDEGDEEDFFEDDDEDDEDEEAATPRKVNSVKKGSKAAPLKKLNHAKAEPVVNKVNNKKKPVAVKKPTTPAVPAKAVKRPPVVIASKKKPIPAKKTAPIKKVVASAKKPSPPKKSKLSAMRPIKKLKARK